MGHKSSTYKKQKQKSSNMATAIKAIPTLYGEEAKEFKKRADKVELWFKSQPTIDWNKNPEVLAVRKMWAEMEK